MTNHSENVISVNNFDMYYEIHGEGPPLLMLHGFTGSSAGLVAAFKQLSSDYQLIIPDLRGHGRSTNPSKQFTFKQVSSDLFALLEHLHIKQCAAVGFSGGGCALLHMSYQQPEKITSMVLVSAAPYFPKSTQKLMKQFALEDKTEEQWMAMRNIHIYGDEQIQLLWDQTGAFGESDDDMNFTANMLSKIKSKTLIVQGDRDPIYPIELTIEMYKGMSNAFLWIVPNAGHGPISADLMQEFIFRIRNFL